MRLLLFAGLIILTGLSQNVCAQGFPIPSTLSTGQGTPGSLDPIWLVSGWYTSSPPNPIGLSYSAALINNNCAPGAWVNPGSLPPPVNNGNWITNASYPCSSNYNDGYIYFRLPINLPTSCDGRSISSTGSYTLSLSGYVDNSISNVYVNGTSTGFSGGGYSSGSQLNMTLTGPWVGGVNYIDVLVYNYPNGGRANPYGLLLVANASAVDTADSDHDGYPDVSDQCPCLAGSRPNGCPPVIIGDTIFCIGDSSILRTEEIGAGYSYLWSTGATTDSVIIHPVANTAYSLTVTGANNFRDSATVHVIIHPLPVITITPATPAVCIGNSVTLTASGGSIYAWSTPANSAATTVSPNTNTTYTVTVTDANSCSTTTSRTVTVNPLPSPTITPASSHICFGTSELLTASGGVSYLWSTTATTDTITISPATTTTYTVTVTDANNCSASTNATVNVNLLPIPVITPSPTQICFGKSTMLTASGGTGYLWSDAAITDTTTVSPATTTTYFVSVTDINNCSASINATVTVNPLPTPSITPASPQICFGNSTLLTASGGTVYLWSNAANTDTTTVSPASTTTYSVTVSDIHSCSAIATQTVTVNPLPNASISPANTQVCIGDNIALTAGGGTSYTWSTTATGPTITVSPTTTSSYSVIVTDANSCSASISRTVTVNPLPTPSVTPATTAICINSSTTLTGSGGVSYLWSNASTATAITVSPIATTTYSVTATDANSCSAIASGTVTVNPLPTAAIGVVPDICLGASTMLTASGGSTYIWSNAATTDTTTVSPSATTNYSVTVTDNNNCSSSVARTVTVVNPMTLTPTITNVSCNSGSDGAIALSVSGGLSPYGYLWSPISATSATVSSLSMGVYTVAVTDHAGCLATASYTVTEPPVLSFTSSFTDPTCTTIDYDGSITLTVSGGILPYQYLWSNNATTQSLTNLTAGSYTVTISDAHNCIISSVFNLAYIYDFTVHATPSDSINLGDSVQIGYTLTGNTGPFTSLWSPATALSCTDCISPIAAPDLSTVYQIRITNDLGCISTDSVFVYVIPDYNIYIPNAFTPNGNGVNDQWQIYGNLKALKFLDIQVFNRWGELVFRSNDLNFTWDGTYKGAKQEPAMYVWQLDLTFIDGHDINQKGSLTLLR